MLYSFKEYMRMFEHEVICAGVKNGCFEKKELVPVRPGRLSKTQFGSRMGLTLACDAPVVVDYYGLFKKSAGLKKKIDAEVRKYKGLQVRMIESLMVHFAAVKIEEVAKMASTASMVAGFPKFKAEVLLLRGFKNA